MSYYLQSYYLADVQGHFPTVLIIYEIETLTYFASKMAEHLYSKNI